MTRSRSSPTFESNAQRRFGLGKNRSELIFLVEDAPEGGYTARALGEPNFTEAEDLAGLHEHVRDAIRCHFEEGRRPSIIQVGFVREEVIAV